LLNEQPSKIKLKNKTNIFLLAHVLLNFNKENFGMIIIFAEALLAGLILGIFVWWTFKGKK
jgi:hypothetical protein